jgi:hypothetical protein
MDDRESVTPDPFRGNAEVNRPRGNFSRLEKRARGRFGDPDNES